MEPFYDKGKSGLRKQVLASGTPNRIHRDFLSQIGQTSQGSRILDIGTGNGYVPREIEKAFPGKYILFGIDLSPEMLETASQSERGFIDFRVGDNNNLPFDEDYFSAVTGKNVTNYSTTELARVLQDNGMFTFREYGKGKGLVEVARCFQDRLIKSRDPSFYSRQLAASGFKDINVHQYTLEKEYSKDELLRIVQMFPFVEDLSEMDLETIKGLFGDKERMTITSDPFILTARRKAR